jgi:hypothetical protein
MVCGGIESFVVVQRSGIWFNHRRDFCSCTEEGNGERVLQSCTEGNVRRGVLVEYTAQKRSTMHGDGTTQQNART